MLTDMHLPSLNRTNDSMLNEPMLNESMLFDPMLNDTNYYPNKASFVCAGTIGTVAATTIIVKSIFTRQDDKPDLSKKTVLIVGGGIGGLTAIAGLRKLDTTSKIILVEPKDHCEIYWAAYRSPFVKEVAEGSLVDLREFCAKHKVSHLRAQVLTLTAEKAILSNGEEIDFHVCTVATGAGSHWPAMGRGPPASREASTREGRLAALQKEGDRILKAKHVVIVGGGLIGVELAGDIATFTKRAGNDTRVTLVHSGPQLCPVMSEKASAEVRVQLVALGVNVYLNERVEKNYAGELVLSTSGNTLPHAGDVIWTVGFVPCNALLMDLPGALDDNGWIQTDEFFRIKGSDGRLFAVGDCTTTLPNAGNQVMRNMNVLGKNLLTTLTGDAVFDDSKLKKVNHGFEIYCATVGPDSGVFSTSAFWTNYVVPKIKNSTMFFSSPKHTIGLE